MPDFMQMPLFSAIGLFLLAAGIITAAGIKMAETADRLADRTGLGEALFGAVLLGGSTSIPGIVTSAATAAQGYPELAFSNAVGGIAAQ
ncbi:MAG: sodium:calcium antiporter, partial [Alphaproteobacteria bacterium]|nr:sodium:calcium antiporter [Alphaproteobacteria bacterium]